MNQQPCFFVAPAHAKLPQPKQRCGAKVSRYSGANLTCHCKVPPVVESGLLKDGQMKRASQAIEHAVRDCCSRAQARRNPASRVDGSDFKVGFGAKMTRRLKLKPAQ